MKKKLISATFLMCFTLLGVVYTQQKTDTIVIFFNIDESIVDDRNANPLDSLFSNKNIISISIYGYADFLGSVAYNQQLSEKRSVNVYNYLIEKGFDKGKIAISLGKGIYPGNTGETRKDLSDNGIKAHRITQVIYTSEIQEVIIGGKISEENKLSEENDKEIQPVEKETDVKELSEENLMPNNLILLENVIFKGGTAKFLPESYPTLKKLLKIMKNHKKMKIEIHGHICCIDFNWENESLSTSRAKAVYDFLRSNRIKSSRMAYKGFGATRRRFPLEQNEYERSMNRRVEIFILEM